MFDPSRKGGVVSKYIKKIKLFTKKSAFELRQFFLSVAVISAQFDNLFVYANII